MGATKGDLGNEGGFGGFGKAGGESGMRGGGNESGRGDLGAQRDALDKINQVDQQNTNAECVNENETRFS